MLPLELKGMSRAGQEVDSFAIRHTHIESLGYVPTILLVPQNVLLANIINVRSIGRIGRSALLAMRILSPRSPASQLVRELRWYSAWVRVLVAGLLPK